jgi:hypothetical protein
MYELEYWCPCQGSGRWLRVEGPDYDDLNVAAAMANHHAQAAGKAMRVVDWQGRVYYQT